MDRGSIDKLRTSASNIVEGNTGAYSEELFFEDFPQFKRADGEGGFAPPAIMNTFLNMANSTIAEARWCECWRLACGLFVAHYLTMYLKQNGGSKGSSNAKAAADSGALVGVVSSASLGDASVSYDTSSATQATQNWGQFNLTTYGQQFASIARMFSMGGMYIF